ncbi:MAG: diaminopimelate epimerase [Nitrososphaerota archaeon]|nr:diaminopimelate epimerase [Nitrososphaerota archaeon]
MPFWKMHGIGNDYVLIDNRSGLLAEEILSNVARCICRRRFSIGADGLLLIEPSQVADVKMRIFNADGSEAEMCGNGIRCFAKYCYENGIVRKEEISVETLAGVRRVWLETEKGKVLSATVDMGKPIWERERIPVLGKGGFVNESLEVDGALFKATCLSLGNPHCVIFVDNVKDFPVEKIGPKIENHPIFPSRINVEFVQILKMDEISVRVWERGVGETLACGTGACASVAAGNAIGKLGPKCIVHLLGGDLAIEYKIEGILMRGPAEKVYEGVILL